MVGIYFVVLHMNTTDREVPGKKILFVIWVKFTMYLAKLKLSHKCFFYIEYLKNVMLLDWKMESEGFTFDN